jgi:hypothetical protein
VDGALAGFGEKIPIPQLPDGTPGSELMNNAVEQGVNAFEIWWEWEKVILGDIAHHRYNDSVLRL